MSYLFVQEKNGNSEYQKGEQKEAEQSETDDGHEREKRNQIQHRQKQSDNN